MFLVQSLWWTYFLWYNYVSRYKTATESIISFKLDFFFKNWLFIRHLTKYEGILICWIDLILNVIKISECLRLGNNVGFPQSRLSSWPPHLVLSSRGSAVTISPIGGVHYLIAHVFQVFRVRLQIKHVFVRVNA